LTNKLIFIHPKFRTTETNLPEDCHWANIFLWADRCSKKSNWRFWGHSWNCTSQNI